MFLWWSRRRIGAHKFAYFGKRSLIVAPRGILAPHRIEIGDGVIIHEGAMFSVVEHWRGRDHEPRLRVGSGCNIGPRIWFSCVGEIDIGADIMTAHDVLIADSFHEYQDVERPIYHQPMAEPEAVRIGDGCYLGAHVAILGGVTIGPGTFVGAGAVVIESMPAHSVVVGNPARVIRHYDHDRREWVEGPPRYPRAE